MDEKKLNPKLKDFSIHDLFAEIASRSKLSVIAADDLVALKGGADLLHLIGLTERAKMVIFELLKQAEIKEKAGGLVIPGMNIPGNIRGN